VHDHEAAEQVALVERLLDELDALPDTQARDRTTEVIQALLGLYGEGLRRIFGELAERDGGVAEALAGDELVGHLLLLHGLHPVPVEARVRQALDGVRPYLESHGGDVELLAVEDGVARLRLDGSCSGCPSSAVTLKLAIERAIHDAAPDVEEVLADGGPGDAPARPALLQIEVREPAGDWAMAGALPELRGGRPVVKRVAGEELLFLGLGGNVYAYRPACPACTASLADATLAGVELECAACGSRYDALRAGRCLDAPHQHLEPVPLLVDDAGLVKVALAARV
jgi:Fe-S cluster biogenesis protein NfuA/nitrite reductase/ring-hydroxylating ferredoxin subunit